MTGGVSVAQSGGREGEGEARGMHQAWLLNHFSTSWYPGTELYPQGWRQKRAWGYTSTFEPTVPSSWHGRSPHIPAPMQPLASADLSPGPRPSLALTAPVCLITSCDTQLLVKQGLVSLLITITPFLPCTCSRC